MTNLKKKIVQLEEQRTPNTPPEVLVQRRDTTTQATREIEDAKKACGKAVDQVSQTWEALMDDEKSQRIANELTTVEANIMQMWNEMKKLPLELKKVKITELCRLQ